MHTNRSTPASTTHTEAARQILKASGTRLCVVDVGSAGGFQERILSILDYVDLIGIDADPDECARLNAAARPGERHVNAALGPAGKTVVLELHKKRQTSSCFATDLGRINHFYDADRFARDGEIEYRATGLDEICAAESIPRIDHLKIDVEGLELEVLKGYSGTPISVETEVSFHPFRRGIPLFDEVMTYMIGRGYFLADLRRTFWSAKSRAEFPAHEGKGLLIHGDALFVIDPFLDSNRHLFESPEQRARFCAVLCLYGYAPEALMMTRELASRGLSTDAEARKTAQIITDASSAKQKTRLPRTLLLLAERLFRSPIAVRRGLRLGEAHQADGDLGN
jgi:FkbM family methyltransferase